MTSDFQQLLDEVFNDLARVVSQGGGIVFSSTVIDVLVEDATGTLADDWDTFDRVRYPAVRPLSGCWRTSPTRASHTGTRPSLAPC